MRWNHAHTDYKGGQLGHNRYSLLKGYRNKKEVFKLGL